MAKKTWNKASKAPALATLPAKLPEASDAGRIWFESLKNPDLCLVNVPNEHTEYFRLLLLKELSERLEELGTYSLQQVMMFLWSVENDGGCTTPAEEFITDIASDHYRYGLTPEMARDRVGVPGDSTNTDGFEYNFQDAIETTKAIIKRYPKIFGAQIQRPELSQERSVAQ